MDWIKYHESGRRSNVTSPIGSKPGWYFIRPTHSGITLLAGMQAVWELKVSLLWNVDDVSWGFFCMYTDMRFEQKRKLEGRGAWFSIKQLTMINEEVSLYLKITFSQDVETYSYTPLLCLCPLNSVLQHFISVNKNIKTKTPCEPNMTLVRSSHKLMTCYSLELRDVDYSNL